jgi:hypothetical protein
MKRTAAAAPKDCPASLREDIFTHCGFARPIARPTSERRKRAIKRLFMG